MDIVNSIRRASVGKRVAKCVNHAIRILNGAIQQVDHFVVEVVVSVACGEGLRQQGHVALLHHRAAGHGLADEIKSEPTRLLCEPLQAHRQLRQRSGIGRHEGVIHCVEHLRAVL
jgi:hypothetical protein